MICKAVRFNCWATTIGLIAIGLISQALGEKWNPATTSFLVAITALLWKNYE